MDYRKSPYFSFGSAADLAGKDYVLCRFFEILPATLAWGTMLLTLFLSARHPMYAAFFLIAFNVYWLLKSFYLSVHLYRNWKRMNHFLTLDWAKMLEPMKHDDLVHLVIFPFYKEGREIVEHSLESLLSAKINPKKLFVVLAGEERAGDDARRIGEQAEKKYAKRFGGFIRTVHPAHPPIGSPREVPGKGSNIAHAAEQARIRLIDEKKVPYEKIIVSAFDIDTVIYPQYFLCIEWHFLTAENPFRTSFQPVPLFNNNMWQAPALSRVVATSGTFWQMIQQERPERLTTFSSHAMPFKTLYEIGYWQKNIVSEDSRIFWNAFAAFDGDYRVVPISYPVSMDANLAPTFWQTMLNVYKQQRRWTWGVENQPYMFMAFARNPRIPFWRRAKVTLIELERAWSLATNPLLLFLLAWLPILIGGHQFNTTILSFNLPIFARMMTLLGLGGILLSAVISLSFLPPPPPGYSGRRKLFIFMQWILIPVTLIVFGSIPALESQTRLALGGRFRLGFWVTPKHRA